MGWLLPKEFTPNDHRLQHSRHLPPVRFGDTERGASLVEYALLVALIAVVCIIAVTFLGTSASSKFNTVGSSINKP